MSSKKFSFHEKVLQKIKQHKKKTSLHTLIGLFVCLIIIFGANIFGGEENPKVKTNEKNNELTMTFTGDIMMGRNVEKATQQHGYDYPFQKVQPFFQNTDFLTANYENPVVLNKGHKKANKNIHLKTNEESANELKEQGFDAINLANNHSMDYGEQGMVDTVNTFKNLDLSTVGAGNNLKDAKKITYKKVNGYKIAVLGFTDSYVQGFRAQSKEPGILAAEPKNYIPLIHKAKRNADIVLVHMHWGQEYDSSPQKRQEEIGHALIDSGADIVMGAHPHVLQPVDFYKKGVIFNSLGNFVFDQGWSRTSETALAQYRIVDGDAKVDIHPMQIKGTQPTPVQGKMGAYRRYKIYSALTKNRVYSDQWKKDWEVKGDYITHTIKNVSPD